MKLRQMQDKIVNKYDGMNVALKESAKEDLDPMNILKKRMSKKDLAGYLRLEDQIHRVSSAESHAISGSVKGGESELREFYLKNRMFEHRMREENPLLTEWNRDYWDSFYRR